MMNPLTDGAIAKISMGMLIAIGTGLVVGTSYLVTLSNASIRHKEEIDALQARQAVIETMQTDIAVIKSKLEAIDQKLGR